MSRRKWNQSPTIHFLKVEGEKCAQKFYPSMNFIDRYLDSCRNIIKLNKIITINQNFYKTKSSFVMKYDRISEVMEA